MYPCTEDHRAENIKKDILSTLSDWDLDQDKLVATTTNNAANMVKACDIAGT